MVEISVVIPAYNEGLRIAQTLIDTFEFLAGRSFEIIVVDDGSTDNTKNVVTSLPFSKSFVRLIDYEKNQGKGFAARTGVLAAKGARILCQDADGSAPISELSRLENALNCGADIAIGSRNLPGAQTKLQAKQHRKLIGNAYNGLVQAMLLPGLHDTQCGFKLYSQESAKKIFSLSVENGFSYDVEVLAIARATSLKIAEIAVDWHHVDGSKVNLALTPLNMFVDIFRIQKRVRELSRQKLSFSRASSESLT